MNKLTKVILVLREMVKQAEKRYDEAVEKEDWATAITQDSYHSGLQQALIVAEMEARTAEK